MVQAFLYFSADHDPMFQTVVGFLSRSRELEEGQLAWVLGESVLAFCSATQGLNFSNYPNSSACASVTLVLIFSKNVARAKASPPKPPANAELNPHTLDISLLFANSVFFLISTFLS